MRFLYLANDPAWFTRIKWRHLQAWAVLAECQWALGPQRESIAKDKKGNIVLSSALAGFVQGLCPSCTQRCVSLCSRAWASSTLELCTGACSALLGSLPVLLLPVFKFAWSPSSCSRRVCDPPWPWESGWPLPHLCSWMHQGIWLIFLHLLFYQVQNYYCATQGR